MSGIVTLTTDFGTQGSYVAEMKGAGLRVWPQVRFVDITHEVPPQDVRYGAFLLRQAAPWFPLGTVHVAVVDPGVGTERRILCFCVGGQFLVGPDNGVLSWAAERLGAGSIRCREVRNQNLWHEQVSSTFHGRDIMVPVAVYLAHGGDWNAVGPETNTWRRIPWPEARREGELIRGEVLFVDPFGNLITNITVELLAARPPAVEVKIRDRSARWVRTYGDAKPGELVALVGSSGYLEVAVVNGSAARQLGLGPGATVDVVRGKGS